MTQVGTKGKMSLTAISIGCHMFSLFSDTDKKKDIPARVSDTVCLMYSPLLGPLSHFRHGTVNIMICTGDKHAQN